MNNQQFTIGQKVRLRTDGDIGKHNEVVYRAYNLNSTELIWEVKDVNEHGDIEIIDYCKSKLIVSEIQIEPAPEPQPKFTNIKVGDWVEHLNGTHLLITAMEEPVNIKSPHIKDRTMKFKCNNRNTYSVFDGSCIHDEDRIVKVLSPKEVIVDFGSGIVGTIEPLNCECCKNKVFILRISETLFIEIPFEILDPQTRAKVESLLKAQEEACQ